MRGRPYISAFVTGARRSLGNPGELTVRILFYLVILVVFASLWRAAVMENDGEIAGYDYRAIFWYVVAAEGVVIATKPRMIEEIGTDISSGAVSVEMLRPVSVVGFRIASEAGEAFIRLTCAIVAGGLFALIDAGTPPSTAGLLLAIPAAALAVTSNLMAQHAFAGAAFWIRDAKASWFLYQKLIFLLGGMLLPLELMPSALANAARLLPFWTMSYVPGRLLSGHFEPGLLLIQAAWLVVLFGCALKVFSMGERKLQVVGG